MQACKINIEIDYPTRLTHLDLSLYEVILYRTTRNINHAKHKESEGGQLTYARLINKTLCNVGLAHLREPANLPKRGSIHK